MNKKSTIYRLLTDDNQLSLSIFDGEDLLKEISQLPNISLRSLTLFSPIIISSLSIASFLKNNEGFGLYLKEANGEYGLNIEYQANGEIRLRTIGREPRDDEHTFQGICRLVKFQPNEKQPYTSIVHLDHVDFTEVISNLLDQSFQVKSRPIISGTVCYFFSELPNSKVSVNDIEYTSEELIGTLDLLRSSDAEKIKNELKNFQLLLTHPLEFNCRCSHEKVVRTLRGMQNLTPDELFKDDPSVSVNCEYCGTEYVIKPRDLFIQ
ncbi:MAG: Hsp33 family molecular chaperone HslO [Bacteriovoracaceae bacterium]